MFRFDENVFRGGGAVKGPFFGKRDIFLFADDDDGGLAVDELSARVVHGDGALVEDVGVTELLDEVEGLEGGLAVHVQLAGLGQDGAAGLEEEGPEAGQQRGNAVGSAPGRGEGHDVGVGLLEGQADIVELIPGLGQLGDAGGLKHIHVEVHDAGVARHHREGAQLAVGVVGALLEVQIEIIVILGQVGIEGDDEVGADDVVGLGDVDNVRALSGEQAGVDVGGVVGPAWISTVTVQLFSASKASSFSFQKSSSEMPSPNW